MFYAMYVPCTIFYSIIISFLFHCICILFHLCILLSLSLFYTILSSFYFASCFIYPFSLMSAIIILSDSDSTFNFIRISIFMLGLFPDPIPFHLISILSFFAVVLIFILFPFHIYPILNPICIGFQL